MPKRHLKIIRPGRPPKPEGATSRAPILYVRLDAETEGALDALEYHDGKTSRQDHARNAIVEHAHRLAGEARAHDAIRAAQRRRRRP